MPWWHRQPMFQYLASGSDWPWPARVAHRMGLQGRLVVVRHEVGIAAWPASTPPLTIAYASDFHAGGITHPFIIEAALDALDALSADLLLLGGDFVNVRVRHLPALARRLAAVPAPLGRFSVLGNHDYIAGEAGVRQGLEDAGIGVLSNRHVTLDTPGRPLAVAGLDDHLHGTPDAGAAFDGAGPVRILLMHSPSSLLDAGSHEFRLALSGHTHGGQIALPNGRPIIVSAGALSRRYASGRFELGEGRTLLVSRGVGCTFLPLRLFATPDVILCTLRGTGA